MIRSWGGKGGRLTSTDTLDSPPTRQTPDRRLGDALDVVAQDFAVPFGAAFAEAFAAFTACEGRIS